MYTLRPDWQITAPLYRIGLKLGDGDAVDVAGAEDGADDGSGDGTEDGADDGADEGTELGTADVTDEVVGGAVVVAPPLLAVHLHPRPRLRLRGQRRTRQVALRGAQAVLARLWFPKQTSGQGESCLTETDAAELELERRHRMMRSPRGMMVEMLGILRWLISCKLLTSSSLCLSGLDECSG